MSSPSSSQASSESERLSNGVTQPSDPSNDPRPAKRRRTNQSVTPEDDAQSSEPEVRRPPSLSVGLDSEDDEELEIRASQATQRRRSFARDEPNSPAEHGILERVECYNFMCHDHFSVELGPLINFIVGKNGSGKSAILTATTLCLGGKASATNRGQSLKSFVKEGKENAAIIVRIKNQGEGAYMPDDYGKSIIVERHFTKTGASGFKIKAENGRIVSTKKAELDAIIDFFTMQFDNPMNVLSQDMARQFLSSSSPAEKYKFFVKGVQLEQLDQDYRLIEESVHQIQEKLKNQEQDVKILENRRDAAKRKLDISDRHETIREKLRDTRKQMAWAQVEEQERIRDSLDEEIARAGEQVAAAEAETGGYDDALQEAQGEAEAAADVVRQTEGNLEEAQGAKNEVRAKMDEKTGERHNLQAQQRQYREYVKAAKSRIKDTERNIAEENERLANLHGGSYARKQEELEQAKHDAEAAKQEHEEHEERAGGLQDELRNAEGEMKRATESVQKKNDDVRQAEHVLQNLRREEGPGDSNVNRTLMRAIQQEPSFTKKPVGPIGQHVSLSQPKWASVLETSFGASLDSFVVTSKRDMNILSNIMQRVNCVCPIFIGSDGHIDTSAHEPDAQFDTALRILEIDNDLVRRQLIINHGIEQMLLIEKVDEASATLFDGERPRNVKRCYSLDRMGRRGGFHLSYSRAGEPVQAPVQAYAGKPRMKSDLASQVRIQREVVEDLKREGEQLNQALREARTHFEGRRQACARHGRQAKDLRVAMQRKEDYVEELKDALDKETVKDGHLSALEATLEEAQEESRTNEKLFSDVVKNMDEIMKSIHEIEQEMATHDPRISALKDEVRVAHAESHKVADKRRRILSDKNRAASRIEGMKQEREEIVQRRTAITAKVLDFNEKASMVSERVEVGQGETPASLDRKLTRLRGDLERYDQQVGASREEVAAEAASTNTAFQRAKNQSRELQTLADIFIATLQYRQKRWKMFRAMISFRAKENFTYLLSRRNFRGRVITDHASKLLDLQVEPDATKESGGRGARTLSGGEKSFSQICLLLALWEAMGSPIRCLDEFDVYMDQVNRKMAIDMLMFAARDSIGRQFILITPGSRQEISLAPDVRVKELAEPERGQTTLAF